ncbi:hypothetical protein [Sphingorhabdus sp. Alg239-R122]|uniref:hypothetical protein n=1 Tax=Sphingorhabdus sp. Alg239-R122 TaxID=2305989 RepID=UPI0013DB6379|nr:hypothetical protein [Sphingorhabdus sp. Alg239-R122]
MSENRKIVGLEQNSAPGEAFDTDDETVTDGVSQDEASADSSYPDVDMTSPEATDDYAISDENEWDWDAADNTPTRSGIVATSFFVAAALAWTGLYIWSKMSETASGVSIQQGIDWFVQWSIPMLLLGVAYLLLIRNSTREAGLFNNVAASLRAESQALEARLHHVNNELSLAREFLANQSLELESLGRSSSNKLLNHAEQIQGLIGDSDEKVRVIGNVSDSAISNIEKLREQLPVISTSAKDVTSQIANAGRTAQLQIREMANGFKRVNEFGQASDTQIIALKQRAETTIAELSGAMDKMSGSLDEKVDLMSQSSLSMLSTFEENSEKVTSKLQESVSSMRNEQGAAATLMQEQLESYEQSLLRLTSSREEEDAKLAEMLSAMQKLLEQSEERIAEIDSSGGESTAKIAFAVSALGENIDDVQRKMATSKDTSEELLQEAEKLKLAIQANMNDVDEALPSSLTQLDERLSQTVASFHDTRNQLAEINDIGSAFAGKIQSTQESLAVQAETISRLQGDGEVWNKQNEDVNRLITSIQSAREESEVLSHSANDTLIAALSSVKTTADEAAKASRIAMQDSIIDAAGDLEQKSEEALEKVLQTKASELVGKLEGAVEQAIGATHEATLHLRDQLLKVDELTANLEYRVQEAREKAEENTDQDFARRVSLLTESLNSTAIDVTKIFSNEVTDSAWESYLKGDRGIFTRRAVRLLDSGEVREIARHYENDMEFRDHVNRYIRDFETMLRNLLATREGGAVGVTLLSSDIGKLYVALAQAIERFRK